MTLQQLAEMLSRATDKHREIMNLADGVYNNVKASFYNNGVNPSDATFIEDYIDRNNFLQTEMTIHLSGRQLKVPLSIHIDAIDEQRTAAPKIIAELEKRFVKSLVSVPSQGTIDLDPICII